MRLGWHRRPTGLRAVAVFWAGLLSVTAVGAVTVQVLGPPRHRPSSPTGEVDHPTPAPEQKAAAEPSHPPAAAPTGVPGRETPGAIAAPSPALLEPSQLFPPGLLPRIAADGRMPSQVYARGFDRRDVRPRIGVLLAGVGLNGGDSEEAVRTLPGAITLAFSPYAPRSDRLLDLTRAAGHEYLISLPMEPQGYPLNDAGDRALLTGASVEQNRHQLEWALTRITGYVGVTGALGTLRGERFAGSSQMSPVLQGIAARGLLYVDPRPRQKASPDIWGRDVDLVIDEPAVGGEIEAKLAALEQIAREKGSALGLAGAVRPVTIGRLTAWANGLAAKGLALAPVSALAVRPQPDEPAQ